MMISSHLKGFWEIQKNWSFRWPRTWRKMWFLDFSHVCRFCSQMSEYNMTWGHLKCNNSLIWLQNLHTCEKSKNHIFLQVRGHRKLQFYEISQKPFKWLEIIIIWHQDPEKCNNSLNWLQNLHTCEKSKKSHFSPGPRSSKTSIFLNFSKAL